MDGNAASNGGPLISGLDIGGVKTGTNLVLAPMSGVTDCAFRMLVRRASGDAVGLVVSEFIAAEGLTRDNEKTTRMLRYKEAERPVSIQIFGADVDRMVRAALMVEETGADIVDINCGCPAPKVVKRGGGAQLMRTPEVLRDIVRGIKRAVSIPVSVKVRAGWDDGCLNAFDVAQMVEDEGASMLAVHGRTRVQLYSGSADWELVQRIRDRLSIPVLGSGDVVTPEDGRTRMAAQMADGMLIGRAAMGNPWVFRQIRDHCEGRLVVEPTPQERVDALVYFRELLAEVHSERAYHGRFRGFACRMVRGLRGSAATRRAIGDAQTCDDVQSLFSDFILSGGHPEPERAGDDGSDRYAVA